MNAGEFTLLTMQQRHFENKERNICNSAESVQDTV